MFKTRVETLLLIHCALARSFRYREDARVGLTLSLDSNEEKIKVWQDADDKAIDADFMRPDAQAGKKMVKDEGVEALEDLRWIEIVVGVRT